MNAVFLIPGSALLETEGEMEALIRLALSGDRDAMEELLSAVDRQIYTFCWRLLGNSAAAEDVTQEVLIRITQKLRQYRSGTNFRAWVFRIAVNLAHDHRRRNAVRAGPETAGAGYDPDAWQRIERVREALGTLTDKQREAILLLDVEGYDSREAASILGTLSITVRTRAAQARKRLRTYLSRYYPELKEQK